MKLWVCLMLAGVSCSKDSSKNPSPPDISSPNGFLGLTEIQPEKTIESTAEEIRLLMEGGFHGWLFANFPESTPIEETPEEGETRLCLEQAMAEVKVSARGEFLRVQDARELGHCFPRKVGGLDFSGLRIEYRQEWLLWAECVGEDMSEFDGMPFAGFRPGRDLCETADEGRFLSNFRNVYKAQGNLPTEDGVGRQIDWEFHYVGGQSNPDGSACAFTQDEVSRTWGDCARFESDTTIRSYVNGQASDLMGLSDLARMKFTGIVVPRSETARWFTSGTARLEKNNWTGTVTYGENGGPSWIMEEVEGTEVLEGNLSE